MNEKKFERSLSFIFISLLSLAFLLSAFYAGFSLCRKIYSLFDQRGNIAFIREGDIWTINPVSLKEERIVKFNEKKDNGEIKTPNQLFWLSDIILSYDYSVENPSEQIFYTAINTFNFITWEDKEILRFEKDIFYDWSPSGDKLYFTEEGSVWTFELKDKKRIKIIERPTQFGEGRVADEKFQYIYDKIAVSPDGKFIMLSLRKNYGDKPEIWIADAKGRNLKKLEINLSFFPKWSPDSKKIAYIKDGKWENINEIWVFEKDTLNSYKISPPPSEHHRYDRKFADFEWSPDGENLLITFAHQGTHGQYGFLNLETQGFYKFTIGSDYGNFKWVGKDKILYISSKDLRCGKADSWTKKTIAENVSLAIWNPRYQNGEACL